VLDQLRQRLQALQKPAALTGMPGSLPLGIGSIDAALGGGLVRGALHEIAPPGEAHLVAATGFALAVSSLGAAASTGQSPSPHRGEGESTCPSPVPPYPTSLRSADLSPQGRDERRSIVWIAEDMALAESGALHGPGLDAFGLAPEQLLTICAAHRRDLLWAMEEALRCRAVGAVIGELRQSEIDMVAMRRLSLAAGETGALALLLRSMPPRDASTAATRWIVGTAPSSTAAYGPGPPRFAAHLTRNRRGSPGSWILEWSDIDERFVLATHAQPVATPAFDRPHRQVA
jgi:protein ImuA